MDVVEAYDLAFQLRICFARASVVGNVVTSALPGASVLLDASAV